MNLKRSFGYIVGIFLSSVILISLAACGGDNGGSSPSLVGTWKLVKIDSIDVSADNTKLILTETTYTYTDPGLCTEEGTYTTFENKLTSTVTEVTFEPGADGEGCDKAGTETTFTYEVTETQITFYYVDEFGLETRGIYERIG